MVYLGNRWENFKSGWCLNWVGSEKCWGVFY